MPLIRIDAIAGRTPEQVKQLLDAAHRAMLTAFQVPERDRYQIYDEHAAAHFIVEDTGLGIARTNQIIVVTVVSRPRSQEAKQKFYAELCRELKDACGMEASDVMVSIVTNTDEDWSFGNGRAQFLTGEL
jgi:phenylpyruvate tautomerase PptA (4-oxalocrotonate tautomerase family)